MTGAVIFVIGLIIFVFCSIISFFMRMYMGPREEQGTSHRSKESGGCAVLVVSAIVLFILFFF